MHERLNLEQEVHQIQDRVSDLWRPNMKIWDSDKIITIFGQQTWDALVHVPAGTGPDILYWMLTSNGQCTSKSAYKMLAIEEATNSPPTNIPM